MVFENNRNLEQGGEHRHRYLVFSAARDFVQQCDDVCPRFLNSPELGQTQSTLGSQRDEPRRRPARPNLARRPAMFVDGVEPDIRAPEIQRWGPAASVSRTAARGRARLIGQRVQRIA
jgi:hypothetical protein